MSKTIVDKEGLAYYDEQSQERNGYWQKSQDVKVGDLRYVAGKDNTGYILECIKEGITSDAQPVISEADKENYYYDALRVDYNADEETICIIGVPAVYDKENETIILEVA